MGISWESYWQWQSPLGSLPSLNLVSQFQNFQATTVLKNLLISDATNDYLGRALDESDRFQSSTVCLFAAAVTQEPQRGWEGWAVKIDRQFGAAKCFQQERHFDTNPIPLDIKAVTLPKKHLFSTSLANCLTGGMSCLLRRCIWVYTWSQGLRDKIINSGG